MATNKKPITITTFEGKKVKPRDPVKVVITNSKFLESGSVRTVHKVQAEKLIADGKAVAYESDEQAKKVSKQPKPSKKDLEKGLAEDIKNQAQL